MLCREQRVGPSFFAESTVTGVVYLDMEQ